MVLDLSRINAFLLALMLHELCFMTADSPLVKGLLDSAPESGVLVGSGSEFEIQVKSQFRVLGSWCLSSSGRQFLQPIYL